jgi:hypothetical protein
MKAAQKIAVILLMVGLSGCGGRYACNKPGMTPQDFKKDLYACQYEVNKSRHVSDSRKELQENIVALREKEITEACLEQNDWVCTKN